MVYFSQPAQYFPGRARNRDFQQFIHLFFFDFFPVHDFLLVSVFQRLEKIIEIADEMVWSSDFASKSDDGAYTFFWLTATPVPASESIETESAPTFTRVPVATATVAPPSDSTDDPAPVSKPSSPICGSAAALPLALVAFIFIRRKQI